MDLNYISHIPLAGGFALAALDVINKPPIAITSYTPFEANDKLYTRYLKQKGYDIPYFSLTNINETESRRLVDIYEDTKVDFVTGVPPCNALAMAAKRAPGSRGTASPNQWMYKSAEFILNYLKPNVYAFENAPNLFTSCGEFVRQKLIDIGKYYGYAITFYRTNTLKHGIPQFRPRTFGIFLKGNYAPILNYYNKPALPLSEYLKTIPKDATLQDKYMNNEHDITKYEITKYFKKIYGEDWRNEIYDRYTTHSTSYDYLKRQNLLEDFKNFVFSLPDASQTVKNNIEHVIKKTNMGKNFRLSYRVLGLDRDYTYAVISEMMNRTIHPIEDRLLNIREYMHLMGLPLDYQLEGPKEYPKLTQNVPRATCIDIVTEIVEIIKGNRNLSNTNVLMQNNEKNCENLKTISLF